MKISALLALLVAVLMAAACAQQSTQEMDRARAAKAREMQHSDAGVHAQYAADAPKRQAMRRWHESHRPWRVLVFHAFRPGILSMCENAHRWPDFERLALPDAADPLKARWLTEAALVQWSGGRFSQPAGGDLPAEPRLLTDACFTLYVGGTPLLSGAVVPTYSARRFDFPALVVEAAPVDGPLKLTLAPRFPAQQGGPVPAGWGELLKGLVDADPTP
ncbi:hypothetical protein [Roseateles sp.]|uniref:hypothetical protein n=1 Tax=Roseateles sp. TaxID=1971397 RepID=UPI003266CAB0